MRLLVIALLLALPALGQPRDFFQDEAFNFEFTRAIGLAPYKGADIQECLQAARKVKEGDFESWYSAWFELAERIRQLGDRAAADGHAVSAREAWLRASAYYRTAEFYLHGNPDDPRILATSRLSRDCFRKAALAEPVRIPYESTTLPGYLYSRDQRPRRTILIQTGFDGTQEELFPQALAALDRGFNALTFEGPGQGEPLREQHLRFRADWEKVVSPVVDYALSRPEVEEVALMGISLGGYLAPRAAAFEPRLQALVANGGVFFPVESLLRPLYGREGLPPDAEGFLELARVQPETVNAALQVGMQHSTNLRWFVQHGMFAFGADSPADLILKMAPMTMREVAGQIRCPTLVIDSERDISMQGQARRLFDGLTCPRDLLLFTVEEGAMLHCQMGAVLISNARIYDWLEDTW